MALITRVARLFRADFHAVLDRIEEPDVLLRQAIREMEEALGGDEHRLRMLNQEQEQLLARTRELDQALHDIEEELDICFGADKDELARPLVRRKLEAQRLGNQLSRRRENLQQARTSLEARLQDSRCQLENMRQKAALIDDEYQCGSADDSWTGADVTVRDEDVEVAFLREKRKRARP